MTAYLAGLHGIIAKEQLYSRTAYPVLMLERVAALVERECPMISTRHLDGLPEPGRLERLCQSLALLDAILSPTWEYRYYSFNAHWNLHQRMASMRNGSGDEYFLLFTPQGAIMKGFAHEAPMTSYRQQPPQPWPGVLDRVPVVFADFLAEPAFNIEDVSFCLWRTLADAAWQSGPIAFPPGPDPDGSAYLLAILDGDPRTYKAFAEGYFDDESHRHPVLPLALIERIYRHEPLTEEIVRGLNPRVTLASLTDEIVEIGYTGRRRQ